MLRTSSVTEAALSVAGVAVLVDPRGHDPPSSDNAMLYLSFDLESRSRQLKKNERSHIYRDFEA